LTTYLDLQDALYVIRALGFYVKDLGLLDSALARPKTTLFGEDAYRTIELKGAAMMHSLKLNQPLVDGNKRTSWFMLTSFLFINSYHLEMSTDQALRLTLGLATDELSLDEAAAMIRDHLIPIS
jgi:death-on-curing protein